MKNILLLTALLAAWLTPALACTSAVVSGPTAAPCYGNIATLIF